MKDLIDVMIAEKEKAFNTVEARIERVKQGNLSVGDIMKLSLIAVDLESARSAMMTLYELKGRAGNKLN